MVGSELRPRISYAGLQHTGQSPRAIPPGANQPFPFGKGPVHAGASGARPAPRPWRGARSSVAWESEQSRSTCSGPMLNRCSRSDPAPHLSASSKHLVIDRAQDRTDGGDAFSFGQKFDPRGQLRKPLSSALALAVARRIGAARIPCRLTGGHEIDPPHYNEAEACPLPRPSPWPHRARRQAFVGVGIGDCRWGGGDREWSHTGGAPDC